MESAQDRLPHRLTWPDQGLPWKPSPMEPKEQPGLSRGHRNTAKRAHHRGISDVLTISNTANLAKPYWKIVHRQVCLLPTLEEFRHNN
jgi:hypothetical protein